ncbi:type 1 glutamine amidotransferase [Pedobacter heparinus]|uniref:GMP synthase-Glutamine amidotransferase domain protein n=1 Tax=Pedobacter heparinus (strain ATCC 13125 / DSM 2366 / CIP 104194 / JCM 7457 / NBRC 12017 / NCIMB 9290 / NRRL B-14731 / HIM 762-3) TaxID=485917 RepID=C6XWF6_PEDHD|nr:GMP synthase [Pedobacter heparinus]ACU06245.1 GMP synthase - Glutamine amidotransferase domain protein [Pedobacter heparinus DSM 2366]
MGDRNKVNVAVIDINNGFSNQGMRGIQEILTRYREEIGVDLHFEVFDLRQKGEIPGMDYDIYISSGGPGSPYDGEGRQWENDFFALLDNIEAFNAQQELSKKHVFLICHSFQMACRKFGVGQVTSRRSTAFGIFPVFLTEAGEDDVIFNGLPNPFYTVDSRDWQVTNPDDAPFAISEAKVLALEKERPHVDLDRCVMAIRFTNEIIGTQFHPEADPFGMKLYLLQEDKKMAIIASHGKEKYLDMLNSLEDPARIQLTQRMVLPNFLNRAINALQEA